MISYSPIIDPISGRYLGFTYIESDESARYTGLLQATVFNFTITYTISMFFICCLYIFFSRKIKAYKNLIKSLDEHPDPQRLPMNLDPSLQDDAQRLYKRERLLVQQKMSQQSEIQRLQSEKSTLQDQLAEMQQETTKLLQSKAMLLANVSHDIRSPLHAIIGVAEQLYARVKDKESRVQLATILEAGRSLKFQVDDLLDYNAMEFSEKTLQTESVDVIQEVETIVNALGVQSAETKPIEIFSIIDPDFPERVITYRRPVAAIVSNIASNAVKYTDSGYVCLNLQYRKRDHRSGRVVLTVTDTGPGILQEDIPKIFEAYNQYHNKGMFGGVGIGLSLVDLYVKKLGGKITVKSDLGKGATFEVYFDVMLAPDVVNKLPSSTRKSAAILDSNSLSLQSLISRYKRLGFECEVLKDMEKLLEVSQKRSFDLLVANSHSIAQFDQLNALYSQYSGAAKKIVVHSYLTPEHHKWLKTSRKTLVLPIYSPASAIYAELFGGTDSTVGCKSLEGVSILSVDDQKRNTQLLELQLVDTGAKVTSINDPEIALEHAKVNKYDIILMDVYMPRMQGTELTRLLRASGVNVNTPIVAATATVSSHERKEFYQSGMNAVLIKPFDQQTVIGVLLKHLSASQETEEKDTSENSVALESAIYRAIVNIKGIGDIDSESDLLSKLERLCVVLSYSDYATLSDQANALCSQLNQDFHEKRWSAQESDEKVDELLDSIIRITYSSHSSKQSSLRI